MARFDGPRDGDRIRRDQAAMAAIASGDEAAFAAIVHDETPRLLRFARSVLTASPAEAEEVVQEALLRLWTQSATWQPNGRISTWLHQVTYRLSIDRLRRRRPSVEIGAIEAELEEPAAARPDMTLIRRDDVRSIRAAIDALPERQRAAIVLCHFQGLGQAEAAAVMGVGESAYESLLARARRRLRFVLAGDGEPGGKS